MAKSIENLGTPTVDEKPTRCLRLNLLPDKRAIYLRLDMVVGIVDDVRATYIYVAAHDTPFMVTEPPQTVLQALGWEVR
jgi:hypothetical protein